jgi:hypothetical protein
VALVLNEAGFIPHTSTKALLRKVGSSRCNEDARCAGELSGAS